MWDWKVREWISGTMTKTVRTWWEATVTPRKQKQEEGETEMWWWKVPETTPVVIEYDKNGNPIKLPENTTTPPVAPDDNTWGWTWWWWRRRP